MTHKEFADLLRNFKVYSGDGLCKTIVYGLGLNLLTLSSSLVYDWVRKQRPDDPKWQAIPDGAYWWGRDENEIRQKYLLYMADRIDKGELTVPSDILNKL